MRRKLWSEISDLSPVDREFGMQSSLMSCSFSPLLFPLSVWIFLKIVGMTSGICLYPVPWVLSKTSGILFLVECSLHIWKHTCKHLQVPCSLFKWESSYRVKLQWVNSNNNKLRSLQTIVSEFLTNFELLSSLSRLAVLISILFSTWIMVPSKVGLLLADFSVPLRIL